MTTQDLLEKVKQARRELEEAEQREHVARGLYSDALGELAAAIALEKYGFSIGDVIEFVRQGKVIRMKITRFSTFGIRDDDPSIEFHGAKLKNDGSISKQDTYCFPSYNPRKIQP